MGKLFAISKHDAQGSEGICFSLSAVGAFPTCLNSTHSVLGDSLESFDLSGVSKDRALRQFVTSYGERSIAFL